MTVFGFIFARGGSKGVKNKNIRLVAGKPLIHYAVETAKKSRFIDRIIVSTDNKDIERSALAAGAEVPFLRPAELASDTSPEWLSWQHAVRTVKDEGHGFDIFVSIPATSPLRAVEDIDNCIQALVEDDDADGVITVCKAARHPSFNMIVRDDNGFAALAMPELHGISRRQDVSPMYDITTVAYAARPEFILTASSLFEGKIKAVVVPRERSLDIDTEFDLTMAELMIKHQSAKE
ncbi:MAG: acylneuraminate cytidylyltransferase family protein [Proteobacteria bacterium]|nr:acylneuraminate cytidylyltransferase family protein [Pseudomonadota bacterium]MBU1583950.1 acylneuraminate cytidylyltransferase family protein [Pseudomonadota bacterium]MBU2454155.1 acylneuraminate cytidylyltransferase family protein [Pseudomonadota bacterium]MBU2632061.1 acylneuraminate cytidylyltransferase family protein [Pseudomonadota bacterium]